MKLPGNAILLNGGLMDGNPLSGGLEDGKNANREIGAPGLRGGVEGLAFS
jgi:hypothetical protein